MYGIKDFLEVKAAGDASFSPDGTRVAYLSNETGVPQVFLKQVIGGEQEQLTDSEDPISFVRFSPTEEVLIYGKAEGGNERTQLYLFDLSTRKATDLTTLPDVRHDFGAWSSDGKRICFSSNERNGTDFDVYVMDVQTREKRPIFTQGEWCGAEGFSPLGTYVVVRQKHSNVSTDLYLCTLATGEVKRITAHDDEALHWGAFWLPDESAFYLVQDEGKEFAGLARYTLNDGKREYVFTPQWDIENVAIDRIGSRLAVTVNENGYQSAQLLDVLTLDGISCRFPKGNIYGMRFSMDSAQMAFVLGDARRTTDVWCLDLNTCESRQLTQSYQGVPPETMIEPELIRFESFDNLSIPAFVYKPNIVPQGTKLPVVIHIHGGPEAQYLPVYQSIIQYLAYSGYMVVAPNVRGSSGYGKTYLALDNVEKRLDSVKDIVALREHLVRTEDIDANKIALYGASYGGFMVLACLAFYPKLWAAGVDIVGIVNFVTFLENTAPYRRALREAEYGSLEHDREILEHISPIRAIESIEAPLLVIHGANDPRVPLSEAQQVVERLRALHRDVELLVYPDEGHGLVKLKNRLDAFPQVTKFLDRIFDRA